MKKINSYEITIQTDTDFKMEVLDKALTVWVKQALESYFKKVKVEINKTEIQ